MPENGISPEAATSVIQSLTATMWTPTATPLPEPDLVAIIDGLNGVIVDSDPLRETIEAKFNVLDVHFPVEPNSQQILVMQIDMECEWITTNSCMPEESFANLMHGFAANDKVTKRSSGASACHGQIPGGHHVQPQGQERQDHGQLAGCP